MAYLPQSNEMYRQTSEEKQVFVVTDLQLLCFVVNFVMFMLALLLVCQWLAQKLVHVFYMRRDVFAEARETSGSRLEGGTDSLPVEE